MKELKSFFYPKTIAVIGASNNPKKVGNILMRKLCECKRKVIPINLNQQTIMNKQAYSNVKKYKGQIDLAVIATPSQTIPKIIKQCGKKKIQNIIIISSGFSEIGNKKLEENVLKIAKKYKIRLIGPNCFGIANPYLNLDTTFSNTSPKKGNIAFISQSGALFSYISDFPIGFSGFVSLGNMSDLTFADFINYFNKDKKTKKIILYIEKVKHGKEFIKACQKSKKQIIVVKAGKTKKGSEAAISHTGSLATDFKIYQGAFKQSKVKVVNTLAEAFNLKPQIIKPKHKNIQILTNAGGAAALITDQLEEKGYKIKVKDLLGTALAKDYAKALKKAKNPLVILTPQKMSEPEKVAKLLKKNTITCFLGNKSIKQANKILKNKKIKNYNRCC